nr:hypothetical protein GCM10020093_104960 [Planobispora longispora]
MERAAHPATVFLGDGRVVGAPAPRSAAVELASRGRSVTAAVPGGREILVAVAGAPGGTAVVRVFLGDGELARGVTRVQAGLSVLGLVLVGLGILVADRLARAVIRPISSLAKVSHRLAAGDMTARTVPGGPPEVHAVGLALNHLAGRITGLLAEERENAADLSHRLRTPLTGLRLEAESLSDPDEAARIEARVDALERAVTAVITEARRRTRERQECDAVAVARDRVAFWSVLAEDQGRTVELDLAPGPIPVAVAADELAACVDALLGNVFAHTGEGSPRRPAGARPGRRGADGHRRRARVRDDRPAGARRERGRIDRARPGHRPPYGRVVGRRGHPRRVPGGRGERVPVPGRPRPAQARPCAKPRPVV